MRMVIDPLLYWQLRAVLADHAKLEAEVRGVLQGAQAKVDAAAVAAGLTVGTNYSLDDATCSAVEPVSSVEPSP